MTEQNRLATVDVHYHETEIEQEPINLFPALVFDASYCGEPVPAGFDAVRIPIDGKVKADLSWKKEREAAWNYISQGKKIFWEMDLGLTKDLAHPLSNKTQYLSLSLSLEHFFNSLLKEFHQQTVGLCLYRGSLDFSKDFFWDKEQELNLQDWVKGLFSDLKSFAEETGICLLDFAVLNPEVLLQTKQGSALLALFCNNAVGEYLDLLGSGMPDRLPLFLLFDAIGIDDPFLSSLLSSSEHFSRFYGVVKGNNQGCEFSWEGAIGEKGIISRNISHGFYEKASTGLCLPKNLIYGFSGAAGIYQAFHHLQEKGISFRVIPEVELMAQWGGLDYLIVDSHFIDPVCKRKLQGFCAAGGTIVVMGEFLGGISQEISFSDFVERMRGTHGTS